MTIKETGQLLAIIKEAHPNAFKSQSDPTSTIKVWNSLLGDLEANLALAAAQAVVSTSQYPPTIAEIREAAYQITHPGELSADEAWGLTLEAIKKYGHYRQIEGLASLPPKVRKIAERMGWDSLCMAEVDKIGVERGQFIKLYNASVEREKEQDMLPAQLREAIGQIGQRLINIR